MIQALYTKTEYSMLNNTIKLLDLIKKAKEYGYQALSITDPNMHGVYKFYELCRENNIKPIIGLEAVIESKFSVVTKILLYCKNNIGYRNLLKISSIIELNESISLDDLKKYREGIFAVSGSFNDINMLIQRGNRIDAYNQMLLYKELFEDFYVGLEPQIINFDEIGSELIELANKASIFDLPLSQTLYLDETDSIYYYYLRAVESGILVKDVPTLSGTYHFKNQEELMIEFSNYGLAFINLENLIANIDVTIEKAQVTLPVFPSNCDLSSHEYLHELCMMGLGKRLKNYSKSKKPYLDRIEYELNIIGKMGYDDYFLIVWDFVKYAKKNQIYVGPGRGSAASSLVAYSLGITDIDPLEYDLLFERFLNPERISMPDIDMDFPNNRRKEVIDYVINKYGSDHVSHIVTFDCYRARGAIRDVAKAMGMDNNRLENVLKYVGYREDLDDYNDDLLKMTQNPEVDELITIANALSGLPRHTGTHAAGIILSSLPLTDIIPVLKDGEGGIQSQYEASDLEKLGLLKIDFLGLKNLTMIDDVVLNIKKHLNTCLDIRKIPLDDKKTYQYLEKGQTTGLFQLESEGMRNVLRKLKPSTINDIVDVLALYRPGPMENIDEYIERKNGKKFQYYHESLEPILKDTYGIIVYQEQIMKIANVFAGYSLGEADILRRAVSKKKLDVLESERKRFVEKSVMMGHTKEESNMIYDIIVKFANYGFNKSHSVAYGIVAYQTAYLKANYPLFFLTELLNSIIGDEKKTRQYLNEARGFGIKVLGPDINKSNMTFQIEDNSIRYALLGIKNVGTEVCKAIIEARREHYLSYKEIKNKIPSRSLEALIKAGAFDSFHITKKALLEQMSENSSFNTFILDEMKDINSEYSLDELIKMEREALGFNLTMSPLMPYNKIIREQKLTQISEINEDMVGTTKNVIGFISKIKEIKTKNNEKMAFFLASNGIIDIEGFIFPSNYAKMREIKLNQVYIMNTKVVLRNNIIQLELLRLEQKECN